MFVDACAIIAVLSDEPEAGRVSDAIASGKNAFTSPVAVLEAVLGLARPDKFGLRYRRWSRSLPSSSTSAGSRSGSAACSRDHQAGTVGGSPVSLRPPWPQSRRLPALRLCEIFRGAHSGDGRMSFGKPISPRFPDGRQVGPGTRRRQVPSCCSLSGPRSEPRLYGQFLAVSHSA